MNVVDSSAWLEYFADGPNADHFAEVIEQPENLLVPSITLLEVFKRISQQRDESAALQYIAAMRQSAVVDLDAALALRAAALGLRWGCATNCRRRTASSTPRVRPRAHRCGRRTRISRIYPE